MSVTGFFASVFLTYLIAFELVSKLNERRHNLKIDAYSAGHGISKEVVLFLHASGFQFVFYLI